ncbi:FHA domain-containing protein [Oscillatoria salina]|uniref:FHA domain-containing protein n=1 Tax=Oscillatoria salina TaxID=331517 RepID=UPI0013BB7CFE|nr:FHA domain-containing protein [Oscillatoria salina]MBZ8182989.1 FHA domain-containing protein [Oscillatoria salina IIICB1]NET86505.1 FHA domain-containing protein [Kamptonema sp. SIO1D9]
MIVCPNCNHSNPDGAMQCEACYTPLPSQTTNCPNCGTDVLPDATFCGQCGYNLQGNAETETGISPEPLPPTQIGGSSPDPEAAPTPPPTIASAPDPVSSTPTPPPVPDPVSSTPTPPPVPDPPDPVTPTPTPPPSPVRSSGGAATQLQLQTASLLHVQTDQTFELPQNLSVIHIGKPNDKVPPDIDVAGLPDSDIVSRIHADLRVEGDNYYLEDVGSSNGTYVNHTPLLPGNRHKLRPGDRLALGKGDKVTFIFQLSS